MHTNQSTNYTSINCNIESQTLPFESEAFDVVLLCEVLEHFAADPSGALANVHRVLKPGGKLIVSTPNVARLENVMRLAAGSNIYDPYSSHGIHGRHNREYTSNELLSLLSCSGFTIISANTRNVHINNPSEAWINPSNQSDGRGDYHFVTAVKSLADPIRKPSWLYR